MARIASLLLSAFLLAATASPASAQAAFTPLVGYYFWNKEASYYSPRPGGPESQGGNYGGSPGGAMGPYLHIARDDPAGVTLIETVHSKEGKKTEWRHEGKYDGSLIDGGWIKVKFTRAAPDAIGNDWVMGDGSIRGYEVCHLQGDRITNHGVQIDAKGNLYPYAEVWQRTTKDEYERALKARNAGQ